MLGIAFWLGLFWRRFNAAGAWATTLAGFAGWWWMSSTDLSEPLQILAYLSIAVVAGIVASLLSARPKRESLDRFHDLIRTPVQAGEKSERSCVLPVGQSVGVRRLWFEGTDFEFPRPSKTSVIGFLLSSAAVGGMILGFVWLMT